MQSGTLVAVVLSSAAFAWFGLTCFLSRKAVTEFARYRLAGLRGITGVAQIAASAGLMVGAADDRLRPLLTLSAVGLAAMMFVALLVRLRIRDPWMAALPAFGLLCLNLYIAVSA